MYLNLDFILLLKYNKLFQLNLIIFQSILKNDL
jgi:hypothetical protein